MNTAPMPAAPVKPPAAPGSSLSALVKRQPMVALGGGAVLLVAIIAYMRKRSAATAAASALPTASTTDGTQQAAYDSSAYDIYDSLESQLAALQGGAQPVAGTTPVTAASAVGGLLPSGQYMITPNAAGATPQARIGLPAGDASVLDIAAAGVNSTDPAGQWAIAPIVRGRFRAAAGLKN